MKRIVATGVATLTVAAVCASGCRGSASAVSAPSERIVAVAPSAVETLYALGLGERVVGVGDFARWPPEVEEKTRIGGLMDPRLETVVALAPDLAVLIESEVALARELRQLDVEVLIVPSESVTDVEVAIAAIAARTGVADAGRELVAELRRTLGPRPVEGQPRVLLAVGRDPGDLSEIYAAAAGTFLDELAGRLGAINVLADAPGRYPRVGLEEILGRRPEIVIELNAEKVTREVELDLVEDWLREMPDEPPCVAVVDGDHVLIPGPRLGLLYEELAAALAGCGA